MKRHLFFKTVLLLCALVAGSSSVWAAPGDEITAYTNVVSGKWYFIKGVYTSSKVEYVQYYGPTETDAKNTKVQSASVSNIANAMPVLFTYNSTENKWTLQTPNGNYIRPHTSNGQSYFVEDAVYMTLAAGTTKAGTGIKIGPYVSGTDNWYIQANKTSAKIGAYKDTQWDVTLIEAPSAAISTAEYASFSSPYATDFSTTGIKVYTATDNENSVTLNEITTGKVPANTPVVLYKASADGTAISVPVIASADAITGTNDLALSTGTDVSNMYVLADGSAGVGFYPWAGTTDLSAGKVYLQAKASYGARTFIGFEEETTSINVVKSQNADGQYYNIAGQRVAQPTKGLYIVNGKKVIIK